MTTTHDEVDSQSSSGASTATESPEDDHDDDHGGGDEHKKKAKPGSPFVHDSTNNSTNSTNNKANNSNKKQHQAPPPRKHKYVWVFHSVIALLTLAACLLVMSTYLAERMVRDYIYPQMELHEWDEYDLEREWDDEPSLARHTYYRRRCNASAASATSRDDLIWDPTNTNSDADDALTLFNRHGGIMIPNLLSPDTAKDLRQFVLSENLKNDDQVDLPSNELRWSFCIEIDHHASVAKASKEILSNAPFVQALEKIVGKNPAVTEFTAVTVAPGAKAQPFHADNGPGANRYSRSFFPTYSLFVALSNVTQAMGATEYCPGSHMCDDDGNHFCDQTGISAAGPNNETDHWPVGWSMLTSQQTFHRGGEHFGTTTDEHRVVFYFRFASRPQVAKMQMETRTFAWGDTHGQKWNQWGHTTYDYKYPERNMGVIGRYLRTYGLYKPSYLGWGWDYLTLTAASLNSEDVYKYSDDDFTKMMNKGGLPLLPAFLQPEGDSIQPKPEEEHGEVFLRYFEDTWVKFEKFVKQLYAGLMVLAVTVLITTRARQAPIRILLLVALIHGVCYKAYYGILNHVASTSWAVAIKGERAFTHPMDRTLTEEFPATIPLEQDILILDDMRTDDFGHLSTVLETYHPGNRAFAKLMTSRSKGYDSMSESMQKELCSSLLRWSRQGGSRTLAKNFRFEWGNPDHPFIMRNCHKEMMKLTSGPRKRAILVLDDLVGKSRFGFLRETVMHLEYIPRFLFDLQNRVMRYQKDPVSKGIPNSTRSRAFTITPTVNQIVPRREIYTRQLYKVSQEPKVGAPYPSAWLAEGDAVLIPKDKDAEVENTLYIPGRISRLDSDVLVYDVTLVDNTEVMSICQFCIKPLIFHEVGSISAFLNPDASEWWDVKIESVDTEAMTYEVRYTDELDNDEGYFDVGVEHVFRDRTEGELSAARSFEVGDKVLAHMGLQDEDGDVNFSWERGFVDEKGEDGSYYVTFVEGELTGISEKGYTPKTLRRATWAS